MAGQNTQVLLGTRVPFILKEKLTRYCHENGIKMNHFISEAIKERLQEVSEDAEDLRIARDRLKDAKFISQEQMRKYVKERAGR